jgi:hypothetical protein
VVEGLEPMDERAALEAAFGNPAELWGRLKARVQHENLKSLSAVAIEFLAVLWCLDRYKSDGINPAGMAKDLNGSYRMKGNWFAELVSLLLENQTHSPLAPRTNVQGFSQAHQIDIAWPAGWRVPLVCVETKVMGGPPVGKTRARPATADWTNRRKELKFQAADLKLFRRQQATHIDHWDNWRKQAPPSVFFLWCARLDGRADDLTRMVRELRALTETYLDGAALLPYRQNTAGTGYEVVPIAWADRVVDVDDLVHRVANLINDTTAHGAIEEVEPASPVVDVSALAPDVPDAVD